MEQPAYANPILHSLKIDVCVMKSSEKSAPNVNALSTPHLPTAHAYAKAISKNTYARAVAGHAPGARAETLHVKAILLLSMLRLWVV